MCEDFEVIIIVNNNRGEAMSAPELYLSFPCDIKYQDNSISSGQLIESSSPESPGFILNSILPGQSEIIRLRVYTSCGLYSCLNNLVSPVIAGNISWGEGSISLSSSVMNIESPNLVISGIDRTYEEVPSQGVFKRKIKITNTRTSRVSEFRLSHIFDPYFSIQVDQGQVIHVQNGEQTLRYDGSDFEGVGNKDEFLDPGEFIEVEETITVLACHYDISHVRSDYEVSWGCGGEICQSSSAIAQIRLVGSIDRGAKITATVIPEEPFCLENAVALQTLNLRKSPHINSLTDLKITIETTLSGRGVIVESLNSGWPFDVEYIDVFENDCGQKLARRVILTIDRISPEVMITNDVVTWRNGFCEPSTCDNKANAYTVAMEYRKECAEPSDSFFTFNADIRLPDMQNISIFGNLLGDTGNIIQRVTDGQMGFIQVRLNDIRLVHFNARDFQIKLTFSRSFEFDNFDFIVNGVAPVSVVLTEVGSYKEYVITYPLPFDERNFELLIPYTFRCDEYNNADAESDLSYASCICNESFRDSIVIEGVITSRDFCDENARPKGCYTVLHSVECPGIPILYSDTLASAFGYIGTMERISFGQSDRDNNGIKDENQNLDDAVLDLHRLLPGDTLRVSISGQIFHDRPDQKPREFSVGLTPLIFFSESLEDNTLFREILFEGDGAFKTIWNKFTLKKRTTGQIVELFNIPETDRSLTDLFILSADSLASFHPLFDQDFYYEPGDSIWLDIYKVIDVEDFMKSKGDLRLEQFFLFTLGIQTHVGHSIPQFLETSPCDCTFERILIPEQYMNAPAAFVSTFFQNTDICIDESISRRILSLNFGYFYRSENLPFELPVFPNEIRPIVQLKEIHFSNNEDVELGQLVITYGNRVFRFDPEFSGDTIIYRTEDVLPWSGHGKRFQYFIDYSIRPNGCINKIPPDILDIDIFLNRTPLGEIYYPEKLSTRIQYQFLRPQLRSIILEPEITAFSETFSTQVDLFFNDNINSLERAYIKLNTAMGNIGQFSLRDIRTQEVFNSENGYFHIGSFRRGDVRRFEISGTLNSCQSEKLLIEYGFDCDDFTDPAYEPCFRATDTILIHFPQGLVDIVPFENTENQRALCDTSTQSLTVLNAGLGRAYENIIELDIPSGVNYISGSGKLYYPGNQRQNFIVLPDPILTGSDIYQWSIGQLWPEHISGLNGANDMPLNTYDIEYNIMTTCDVISGSTLTYRVSAKDYCRDPLNEVIKTGQSIMIKDLMPSEPVQIHGSYEGLSACSKSLATLHYHFFSKSDVPQIFQLRLPVGFEIVPNSIVSNLSDPIPVTNGRVLSWNILPSDSEVNIVLDILNKSESLCENNIVESFLSEATSAVCVQTGIECDIFSASGQNQILLTPETFDVDIQDIKLSADDGQYRLTFKLEKVAIDGVIPIEIILFKDSNKNGQLDISDEVLDTLYFESNTMYPDFILSDSLNTEDICALSLLVREEENCLCEEKYYSLNQNVTIETPELYLCSGENVEIGIQGMEGFDYQWNNGQGMNCTQCPKAIFTLENQTNEVIQILRILELKNKSNCKVRLEYPLVIPPELVLNTGDVTICQGDTVRVLSDIASQYFWQGPGINVNNIQELVASPSENAIYSWMAIDSLGCQYSDSFTVSVAQRSSIEIIHHLPFCPDSSAQVNVNLINADYYTWNLTNLLTDPNSLSSSFNIYEDTTLILEAFNETCKEKFFIPIEFIPPAFSYKEVNLCEGDFFDFNGQIIRTGGEYCQRYKSESGCDSLSCVLIFFSKLPDLSSLPRRYLKQQDEDLVISGLEGFEVYSWMPNDFLSCDTCEAPTTTTTDTITYIIELTDEAGCKAVHRVFIDIEKTCQLEDIIFPNGFSPNDDGINDIFSLIFDGFCGSMDIVIYNRWGNVVYDMEDWDNAWGGRSITGEILPQGTYFYNIRLRTLDQSVSGMIDLRLK